MQRIMMSATLAAMMTWGAPGSMAAAESPVAQAADRASATAPAVAASVSQAPQRLLLQAHGGFIFRDVYERSGSSVRAVDLQLELLLAGESVRATRISTPVNGLQRRLDIGALDASQLQWQDGRLVGELTTTVARRGRGRDMAIGENGHSMMKAQRVPALNWSIGGRERVAPSPLTIHLDVAPVPGEHRVALELHQLLGDERVASPPAAGDTSAVSWEELGEMRPRYRRGFQVDLVRTVDGWLPADGRSPRYNKGLHQVDASGLELTADGRLVGDLAIVISPDGWVPSDGRPRSISVAIDLDVASGSGAGTYQLSGELGERSGPVSATTAAVWEGQYRITDIDGERAGLVAGGANHLAGVPAVTDGAQADAWAHYQQVDQVQRAQHDLPAGGPLAAPVALSDTAAQAVQAIAAAVPDRAEVIVGHSVSDLGMLPSGVPEPVATPVVQAASASAPVWQQITGWQAIGPFVTHPPAESSAGVPVLPEVVPQVATWHDQRTRFAEPEQVALQWHALTNGVATPPAADYAELWVADGKMSSYKRHPVNQAWLAREREGRSHTWYAAAQIDSQRDGQVWLAVQVANSGQIWLDGRLVWRSADDHDPAATVLVPVTMSTGSHELLVRAHQPRIGYFPPEASLRSRVAVAVCVAGDPVAAAAQPAIATEVTPGAHPEAVASRVHAEVSVPFAANISSGSNVAWRQTIGAGGPGPVAWGDAALLASGSQLRLLAGSDGSARWQLDLPAGVTHRSLATVVGERAWLPLADGSVVAVARDGAMQWASEPLGEIGQPLAVHDDLVLVSVVAEVREDKQRRHVATLIALDAATGVERWRSVPRDGAAPPLTALRLATSAHTRDVVLTGSGCVYDMADGGLIRDDLSPFDRDDSSGRFMLDGTRAIRATRYGQLAWDLSLDASGGLRVAPAWHFRRRGWSGTTPLVHGGNVYVARVADEYHDHHPVTWLQMDVYDRADGQHLAKPKPAVYDALDPRPVLLAGDVLVYADGGGSRQTIPVADPGATLVFYSAGPDPVRLAEMAFPERSMRGAPTVVAGSLVLQLDDEVIAFALTSEGAEASTRAMATEVQRGIGEAPAALTLPAQPGVTSVAPGLPRDVLRHRVPPTQWRQVVSDLPTDALAAAAQAWSAAPTTALTVGDQQVGLAAMPDGGLVQRGTQRETTRTGGQRFRPVTTVNLRSLVGRSSGKTVVLTSVLSVERDLVVHLDLQHRGSQIFLDGEPITAETPLHLAAGDHALAIAFAVGRLPPRGQIRFTARFIVDEDPALTVPQWLAKVDRAEDQLRQIIGLMAGTGPAIRAAAVLEAAGKPVAD